MWMNNRDGGGLDYRAKKRGEGRGGEVQGNWVAARTGYLGRGNGWVTSTLHAPRAFAPFGFVVLLYFGSGFVSSAPFGFVVSMYFGSGFVSTLVIET